MLGRHQVNGHQVTSKMDLIVSWSLSLCPMLFQFHSPRLFLNNPSPRRKINVTCKAKKFYPQGLQLTWMKSGNASQSDKTLTFTMSRDGLYTVQSLILVNRTDLTEDIKFTCQVEQDGRHVVTAKMTYLWFLLIWISLRSGQWQGLHDLRRHHHLSLKLSFQNYDILNYESSFPLSFS